MGASTGVAGDSSGIYGGTVSVCWHRGGMETRSIGCGGAVDWTLISAMLAMHRVSELPHESPPLP